MSGASESRALSDGSAAGEIVTSLTRSRRQALGCSRPSLFGRRLRRPAMAFVVSAIGVVLVTPLYVRDARSDAPGSSVTVTNESGRATTINLAGFPIVAPTNPFFLDLGINGRRCVTCHQPGDNMTVTPASLRARFDATDGTDPIFRTNDGSNTPLADVSTVDARRAAYSLLLAKGVIRIGLAIPATAEFALAAVVDPYGYAGDNANGNELSLFRRPLPATNLGFLSSVMWDGRETVPQGTLHLDLSNQANGATQTHAQAPLPIDQDTREQIVAYQMGNFTAQVVDRAAGDLTAGGAQGGPLPLAFVIFGCDGTASCDSGAGPAFPEYDAWTAQRWSRVYQGRQSIARGQAIFNTRPFVITGVFSDDPRDPGFIGSCASCHNTPHAGNQSVLGFLNIGVAAPAVAIADGGDGVHNRFGLPAGDLPVYTLRHTQTDEVKVVTDPGRALITGAWTDIGSFKVPILRGLSGRPPYFHNGSAASLDDVISFYVNRFDLTLTPQDRADLIAFLRAL